MDKNAKKSKYKLRAFVIADELRKIKKEIGNDRILVEMAGITKPTLYKILRSPENVQLKTINKIRVNLEIDKEL